MLVFFDTETTGLPAKGSDYKTDFQDWPYLVQMAWIAAKDDGTVLIEYNHLIRPNGWQIPEEAARVHGYTSQDCLTRGFDLERVLVHFLQDASQARRLVAHNIHFDTSIIKANLLRLGMDEEDFNADLDKEKRYDTMLEGMRHTGCGKWPKLTELHRHLFGEEMADAHDAMNDVRAMMRCYFKMNGEIH